MNYKETIHPAELFPNIMERDYGNGVVLAQSDDENGDVIPYSVFNFQKQDWSWAEDYYMTEWNFETLEEAEAKVAEFISAWHISNTQGTVISLSPLTLSLSLV